MAEVASILADLPEWFGIEEYTRAYVDAAARMPTYLALDDSAHEAIGVLLTEQHFPTSAEVHVVAVRRAWHRRGIGRQLLAAAESDLAARGVRMLSVKTLGPSRIDAGYEATRHFYESAGFIPIEEFLHLWPSDPCLLMVKAL
jgi:ribosomal protein S18 acetylase RimI-like enzyme